MRRQRMYSYQSLKNSRQPFSRRRSLYSQKRVRHYAEPLFAKKSTTRRRSPLFKKTIRSLLLCTCIMVGIGVLLYLPYFRIKKITSQGFKNVSQTELETFVQSVIPKKTSIVPKNSFFILNTKDLESKISEKFSFNSVKVKKKFPDGLSIEIEERNSKAVVFTGTNYYLIDETGMITQKILRMINPFDEQSSTKTTSSVTLASNIIPTTPTNASSTLNFPNQKELGKEYTNLPLIFYQTDKEIMENQKTSRILTPETISSLVQWKELLEKNKITSLRYASANNPQIGVELYSNFPWKVLIDPNGNPTTQFESLKAILKNFSPQEYVDVRYEGRVYWK